MHGALKCLVLLLICYSDVCFSIRVPVEWHSDDSEVQVNHKEDGDEPSPDKLKSQNLNAPIQNPIPKEYFQYTAKKPQFAVDISKFHGVKSPHEHYIAYPVRPYTGKQRPDLGKHKIFDQNRPVYNEYQKYVLNDNKPKQVSSVSSNYEVFHPYKEEEPALQALYKDPILDKIRNDIRENKNRLQKYEIDAGKADISNNEYLESLDETDRKKRPQKNIPATYEIHRPLRKPLYYRANPNLYHRDQYLNQKFRNPWNHFSKVRPVNYHPIKQHLQNLRQHHAIKYDDEHNEYPQLPPPQSFAEPSDGYDIYENAKEKYKHLRDQFDDTINESIKKNRPTNYNKLELQNQGKNAAYTSKDDQEEDEDEDDFVPIKNYAQVRKSATFKHLPRKAAFDDADNLDEVKNAPRLKEAVKSTKAQTVYTEEGYEDTAYDHAGEQKHAGDHETHGGFLREKELSGGNYKIPTISANHDDGSSSVYRDQLQDGKQWKDSKNDEENENDEEDYTEEDQENSNNEDVEDHQTPKQLGAKESRIKRANTNTNDSNEQPNSEHDLNKRDINFQIPDIDLNTTFLSEKELSDLEKIESINKERDYLINKYPYYFKNNKNIHEDSPLRYAEDLKFIPLKNKSDTAFYDSKSKFQCPEVDDTVDPVPDNLKKGERPDSNEADEADQSTEVSNKEPRLKGLGDKIDCFKAKYFGENPLDSPFFKEQLIENPKPLTVPNLDYFKLSPLKKQFIAENATIKTPNNKLQQKNDELLNAIFQKLNLQLPNKRLEMISDKQSLNNATNDIRSFQKANITHDRIINKNITEFSRRKRETSFVYKPYKILEETQIQGLKRHLKQSSLERNINDPKNSMNKKQPVKRNIGIRSYTNIGKNDRLNYSPKNEDNSKEISFVIVDKRRGEPRYEVKVNNHKSRYVPVHDKRSMSVEDFKKTLDNQSDMVLNTQTLSEPFVSKPALEFQKTSSSNTIKRTVAPVTANTKTNSTVPQNYNDDILNKSNKEDYDDYEDENEEDEEEEDYVEVSTTTTPKPAIRKKTRVPTSTSTTPYPSDEGEVQPPKLKLITRFRNTIKQDNMEDSLKQKHKAKQKSKDEVNSEKENDNTSQFVEKKKKTSHSTLVSDTNTYADNEDDMRKEEVDALIGVKEDMKEYMPLYEKELENSPKKSVKATTGEEEDDDEEEDDSSSEEEDYDSSEEIDSEEEEEELPITKTTEKDLVVTTEIPKQEIKTRSNKQSRKPVVVRKTIEIHKELPYNKSSPHVTQFKQDFKEVEIIKSMPRKRKLQKNLESLDLYKDQNLAKDINDLKAVEVFKENLDLAGGPKHGGNYRSARVELPVNYTSQNENQDEYEDDDSLEIGDSGKKRMKNKSSKDLNVENYNKTKNLRKTEKYSNSRTELLSNRNKSKAAKLIELQESEEDEGEEKPDRNVKTLDSKRLHGGNYRSGKLVNLAKRRGPPAKANSASVLNSFAQAASILTTTPAYILDPSKRKYYYVDA